MEKNDKAMTIKEVAKFLNISNQMVYNLVNSGTIQAFKIGTASRIMYSDLITYINSRKNEFNSARDHGPGHDNSRFGVHGLNMSLGDFSLKEISFELPIGKIMTILGPSGSGKTMLLRTIAGLEKNQSGSIFLGDWNITPLGTADRKVGFVFEKYSLFPTMNARKNIEFPLKIRNQNETVVDNETENRVSELNIEREYLHLLPEHLPEGMKQLIAIAREKNHPTELLLLDEPMSQLDPQHHSRMRIFIQKIIRDMGKTTILSFHSPEDALALSDYIGIMDEGRMIQFGETWDVYHHPESPIIMEMLSKLGLNILKVEKEDGEYKLAFRPEEVEVVSGKRDGARPVTARSSQILNGTSKLTECETEKGERIRVVVPLATPEEFSIRPLEPRFFREQGQ